MLSALIRQSSPIVEEMATPFLAPSKSQRKREMHEVQALGEALVALSVAKLETLDLPERLFDAIVAVQTITRHEARRRQMQFIGRLMRDVDPEPIRAFLAAQMEFPAAEKAKMALLENWRKRLLEEPVPSLEALAAKFPDTFSEAVRETWRQRIAQAQQERRQQQATPRHYRLLFQDLKTLFEAHADDVSQSAVKR
jgi:ribosome-associated protein